MSRIRLRKVLGAAGTGALVLAMTAGFGMCNPTKPAPPPELTAPHWSSTTVNFFHQQTPVSGNATGWVTTVTVPNCTDSDGGTVFPVVSVSNGTIAPSGSQYAWTRAVTGAPPVQRVPGTFTADCIDKNGLHAHPVLAVQAN